MSTRSIKKVAILGSGVMGSRIACHFANIGVEVILLDIVPKDAAADKKSRNKIVDDALAFALKSNPSPIYRKAFAKRITTGNFDDNMKDIASCDWIIEVVIERLDIKKQVFDKVEQTIEYTPIRVGDPKFLKPNGKLETYLYKYKWNT